MPEGRGGGTPVVFGDGVFTKLRGVLRRHGARSVLVIASAAGRERTRIAEQLAGLEVSVFDDFAPNPELDAALAGARMAERIRPDAILGLGGGSAIDTAKLVRLLPPTEELALAALAGDARVLRASSSALVVVPTTAGTGSEVTQFAAVWRAGRKHSLDHPAARADVAVVDPALAASCPRHVRASCALDGVAQAIESSLSVRSTPASRRDALDGLRVLGPIVAAGGPHDRPSRRAAARASILIGRAINVSRTTLGHAFAYPTTALFGVPHGLACALHVGWLLPALAERADRDCRDPRGRGHVEDQLDRVAEALGVATAHEAGAAVLDLVQAAGFPVRLSAYDVTERDLPRLAAEAFASARASTTPVALDSATAVAWLRQRL